MTSSLPKFLFETDFETAPADEPEEEVIAVEEEEPELPPEPTFSEEELRLAREESFQAGKEEGLATARSEREAEIAGQLQSVGAQLTELSGALQSHHEESQKASLQIALASVRKMLPHLEQRHGLAEVESIVTDCMESLHDEPRLVIRVADEQLDALKERIETWAARNAVESKFIFLAEPELGPSDVRVEWADGGAERNSARMWQEIEGAVARVMPGAVIEPMPGASETQHTAAAATSVVDHVPHEMVLEPGIAKVS